MIPRYFERQTNVAFTAKWSFNEVTGKLIFDITNILMVLQHNISNLYVLHNCNNFVLVFTAMGDKSEK